MAPNIPARYQPQVRLGRDGDIEEWLATDTALDRPVLVRLLATDASPNRKNSFLIASRGAAAVVHSHLTQIYDVEHHGATPHAILEWTGGVTIQDRLQAGEVIPSKEFLANAAGLAEGLAALHASGQTHSAIDTSAIHFSPSHPAKLGSFGRIPRASEPDMDTVALASALRAAVTGSYEPLVRPSQVVNGIPSGVDTALAAAESGEIDAASLAAMLHNIPEQSTPTPSDGWSWGWVAPAAFLLVTALLVSIIGLSIGATSNRPFLFPATPLDAQTRPTTTPATITEGEEMFSPPTIPDVSLPEDLRATPAVYDPHGGGKERDDDLPNLVDGNATTTWRTERYFSPLSVLGKPGVGITFNVSGSPSGIEFTASPGTRFRIRWASSIPSNPSAWEEIASGTALGTAIELQLPPRKGGVWLIWLVDLPEQGADEYFAEIGDVTFRQ